MAEKKTSLQALKMRLGKLRKAEQTLEVDEQIKAIELQIENFKPEPKEDKKPKGRFPTYEVWRLEKKIGDGKVKLIKDKKLKEVKILDELADILNAQKKNTFKEYIKKEA